MASAQVSAAQPLNGGASPTQASIQSWQETADAPVKVGSLLEAVEPVFADTPPDLPEWFAGMRGTAFPAASTVAQRGLELAALQFPFLEGPQRPPRRFSIFL